SAADPAFLRVPGTGNPHHGKHQMKPSTHPMQPDWMPDPCICPALDDGATGQPRVAITSAQPARSTLHAAAQAARHSPDPPNVASDAILLIFAWVARVCRSWWGWMWGSPAAAAARLIIRVTVCRS